MRPVLLILVLLGASAFGAPDWKRSFNSLFSETKDLHKSAANYYGDLPKEPVHQRLKRAVKAVLGISQTCSPGWTGQYCENPICSSNTTVPVEQNTDKLVDFIYAPSGCAGTYYVPIDSTCDYLFIQANTNGPVPYFNLTDENGNVVVPTNTRPTTSHNMNFYQPIAPGKYLLTIDTHQEATSLCAIEISVASKLDISHGFVDRPQDDFPTHGTAAGQGRMQNLILHTYHPEIRALPSVATILTQRSTVPLLRSTLTSRYSCSYEQYIGGTFMCSVGSIYQVTTDGIDANGFAFRRTKTGWGCVEAPPTTPAPTTPLPTVCLNGGTILYAGTPNAQCLCTELFTGASCQLPQCMNAGFLNPDQTACICPTGYTGDNCQDVYCNPNQEDFLTDSKTLVVVWRAVQSMNQYVNAYAADFYAEMEYLQITQGFEPYRGFILITYANGALGRTQYSQQQWDQFYSDFTALNSTSVVGNCTDTGIAALTEVFRLSAYEKSSVYHFTDAPASDFQDYSGVTDANSYRKLPIFSFFHPTDSAIQCKIDEISEGYRVMGTLAYMSGGLVMGMGQTQYDKTFAITMRATSYKSNQVLIDDLTTCTINGYRTFFADSKTRAIHLIATGENLLIAITDPNGKITSPQIFQDGRNYFYTIQGADVIRGEYLLQFNAFQSQIPCSYRVFALSDYDLFVGVTNAVYTDAISAEPIYGMPNAVVAQLNGIYNKVADPFRLFAEITIVSNDDGNYHRPLYFSNGIYRTGCGYHMYFGTTDFCEKAGQVFYAIVYADDPDGYTIQRTTVGYCTGRPITQAPPTGCINGGVPDPNNSTQCLCPPLYAGRYCQDYNCQNGALYQNGICQCPPGFGGTFCEQQACLTTNSDPQFSQNGQSMTFVISTLGSMNQTWTALANGVQEFVKDIQIHAQYWITRYNLVIMTQTEAVLIAQTPNAKDFVAAIQSVAANLSNFYDPSNQECRVLMETGMLLGVQNSFAKSSIYVFSDSNAMNESGLVTVQLTAAIDANQIQVNLIGLIDPADPLCGGTNGYFDQVIQDIVIYSAGWLYNTRNVQQFYNFILTEYNNGIILDEYALDCTTPQIYYLPVDSASQSMTIVVNGLNVSMTVTQPDGRDAKNSNYELNIIREQWMRIDQFMIPCPGPEWQYYERTCLFFILQATNWVDASSRCHGVGGWLVDVFYQGKQDYIRYQAQGVENWIGLMLLGGTWYWDVPNGNTATPLTNNSFTNWKDGQWPSDPNNNCVIMDKDEFWVAVPCTNNYVSVCQRYRFGQEVTPNDPTTNLLPAGFWKVAVQSASDCAVQARVQSTIQLYFGFVQDTHNDYARLYANSNATNNYFIVGATGLNMFPDDRHPSNAGRLNYVYTGSNSSAYNALTVEDRASCSYTYLSQSFACQNRGAYYDQFFVRFSGLDQYGYTFDRLVSAYCGVYQTSCANGGWVYQGQCVCPTGWTGQSCRTPVCLHGGVVNPLTNQCSCPSVWGGTNCELAYCEPPRPVVYADKRRTLAIAIETSTIMATSIYLLRKDLQNVINSITNGSGVPEWWDSYVLYPFDSTSNMAYWMPPTYSNNFSDITAAINSIPRGCPNQTCDNTICQRPYLRIISDIIAHPSFKSPNSDILVVTRASPEDYNIQYQVINAIQSSRARVYFLLAGASSPCNEGWNTQAVQAMQTIAQYTQGGIYPLSPVEMLYNWIGYYFLATYRSGVVAGGGVSEDCSNSEWIIPIENAATHLLIDYFGNTQAITLIAPDGIQETLPNNLVTSSTNYLGVFNLRGNGATKAGQWIVRIQDPDTPNCDLDLRVRSEIEIYPAFTVVNDQWNGATNDDAHFQPIIGAQNLIVAHESTYGEGATLEYAQIIVPNRGLYFVSEMAQRSTQCGYEYYSTKAFQCYMENFFVIIYGTDARGAPINRYFVSHCVSTRPTPPPPAPFCDLSQTQNDIVFMVDGSANVAKSFGVFKLFMSAVAQNYTIGTSGTQFGAFSFSNQAGGPTAFFLNAAGDADSLNSKFMGLANDGAAGQNITNAISYITPYADAANGYRVDNRVKHFVVYLTGSSMYSDLTDPKAAVSSLTRSGTFGFVVVGLGITQPPDWLVSLAPSTSCSYFAVDDNDLATNGANLIQSLSCYRNNICAIQ